MGEGRGNDSKQKTQHKIVGINLNTLVSRNLIKLNSLVKRQVLRFDFLKVMLLNSIYKTHRKQNGIG